jgi:DNA polymerase V
MPSAVALVDCNNFYVSCQRAFDGRLIGRPVVVLSLSASLTCKLL